MREKGCLYTSRPRFHMVFSSQATGMPLEAEEKQSDRGRLCPILLRHAQKEPQGWVRQVAMAGDAHAEELGESWGKKTLPVTLGA